VQSIPVSGWGFGEYRTIFLVENSRIRWILTSRVGGIDALEVAWWPA